VDRVSVGRLLDGDQRVILVQRGEERGEHVGQGGRGGHRPDPLHPPSSQHRGQVLGRCGLGQHALCRHEEGLPGSGQHEPAPVAPEEGEVELALELLELAGERRLGDVELIGSSAHRASGDDGGERGEQA